jgi:hypothetical protein
VDHLPAVAGVVGGLLSSVDPIPYIRDTLRGRTHPHRGTWLIWSVLACVALSAQWAQDGAWSLVVLALQAASMTLILLLSIRRGVGGASAVEVALLVLAGVGVAGWLWSTQPLVAMLCVLAADLIGSLMMLPKTWRDPWSETLSTFWLSALAAALGTVAVGSWAPQLLLYPAYLTVVDVVTASLILGRRRVLTPRRAVRPRGAAGSGALSGSA